MEHHPQSQEEPDAGERGQKLILGPDDGSRRRRYFNSCDSLILPDWRRLFLNRRDHLVEIGQSRRHRLRRTGELKEDVALRRFDNRAH